MKKPIKQLETRKVTLSFEDGVEKELQFNINTMMILDQEFEEGSMKIIGAAIYKPFLNGAKIIYAGLKSCDEDITFEKAKQLVVKMDLDKLMEIIEISMSSIISEKVKTEVTEEQIKILAQLMK